jgi:hypothetical protein
LDRIPVALDEQSLQQTLTSVLAKDLIGMNELIASGRVVTARSGTPILLLDRRVFNVGQSSFPEAQVRLLAGKQFTKSGWVASAWLEPISKQTVKNLPMSKEDVLENYNPEPQLVQTISLPDGGTTYLYAARYHTLVMTENGSRLICSRLIFDINEAKENIAAGLAFTLQSALFLNEMAGYNVVERENAIRLGLNAAWSPTPSEVTSHCIRVRRYILDSRLVLEATPESLPQVPPMPRGPSENEN